jgi:hypothetical protein
MVLTAHTSQSRCRYNPFKGCSYARLDIAKSGLCNCTGKSSDKDISQKNAFPFPRELSSVALSLWTIDIEECFKLPHNLKKILVWLPSRFD